MRKLSLGLIFLFVIQLGASAPESSNGVQPGSGKSKTNRPIPAMTPQSFGDKIAQMFSEKKSKNSGKESSKAGASSESSPKTSAEVPAVSAIEKTKAVGATAMPIWPAKLATVAPVSTKTKYVTPAPVMPARVVRPPAAQAGGLPQIRQEIQRILDLNRQIRAVQSGRTGQFQRIQEQGRIHQKILSDLENAQKKEGSGKEAGKESLLAQEKLRVIHEETGKNAEAVAAAIKTKAGTKTAKVKVAKEKTASQASVTGAVEGPKKEVSSSPEAKVS